MSQELNKQDITRPESSPIVRRPLEETDNYVEEHLERERTLWQKVFPDKQRRYIEQAKRKAVRSHYEHQHQVLQIAHEARLQEIKEIYNDFLVKGKTKIRKEQAEFFQVQFETLVTNISNKSQSFGERINEAYLKLDNIKVETLRKHQEQLIESITGDYYETVDKLIKNFRKILDEEIHNPGIAPSSQGMEG